jgi:hypothetical protein
MVSLDPGELKQLFQRFAIKTATRTDIDKDAYVVTTEQRRVLGEAGYYPGVYPRTTRVPLNILGTDEVIMASYYGSQRAGSGRTPEYRMGRFLGKLKVGDKIVFGTDGRDIFMCRLSASGQGIIKARAAYEESAVKASERLPLEKLISRAVKAKRKPDSQQTSTTTYYRDPAIIAFVHRRSEYRCEMPKCNYVGFKKLNGEFFIETHHIKPLSEDGEDSISNVAALCPNCHRKMHYSYDWQKLSEILRAAVQKANERLGIEI